MTYTITEEPQHNFKLLRHGKPVVYSNGLPNNCELEFWMHLQAYKAAYEAAARALWMAEKYADGDSTDRTNFNDVETDIEQALQAIGVTS